VITLDVTLEESNPHSGFKNVMYLHSIVSFELDNYDLLVNAFERTPNPFLPNLPSLSLTIGCWTSSCSYVPTCPH
jgi:hypothetical protein